MSARDDMEAAFPRAADRVDDGCNGMDLRDYFAAKAMSAPWMPKALADTMPHPSGMTFGQRIAEIAYAVADRMMLERAL